MMVKNILIKSPDEWATTKQACRDESVVPFLHKHIYVYIYIYSIAHAKLTTSRLARNETHPERNETRLERNENH